MFDLNKHTQPVGENRPLGTLPLSTLPLNHPASPENSSDAIYDALASSHTDHYAALVNHYADLIDPTASDPTASDPTAPAPAASDLVSDERLTLTPGGLTLTPDVASSRQRVADKVARRSKKAQEREMELWSEAMRDPDSYSSMQALEKLTACYRTMIEDLARKVCSANTKRGPFGSPELSDYIAEGFAEMINSFGKFSPYYRNKLGQSVLLSTYVYYNVNCAMLACVSAQDPVRCPHQKQALVRLLNGGYDDCPQRKEFYENKYNIHTEDDRAEFAWKNASLLANHTSFDRVFAISSNVGRDLHLHDILSDERIPSEDQIINRIMIDQVMDGLNGQQQDIFRLHRGDKYTRQQVSDILGIPLNEVKRQIEKIDSHLLQFRSVYARAERRQGHAA